MTSRTAAIAGLALGLLIALAANLTYAVPRGPVTVGLGLIAPLVLPVALYIRTTFTASGFWHVLLRETATLAVAGPAAAISYVHTYELVLSVHEPVVLALLAPLSSDGLAGMATLALHRIRDAGKQEVAAEPADANSRNLALLLAVSRTLAAKPEPVRRRIRSAAPAPAPESEPAPARAGRKPSKTQTPREWAMENWPKTGAEIQFATGCSRGYAYKLAAELRTEQEAAS